MTPAVEAVRAAGIAFEVVEYVHDAHAASYGLEAAEHLGVEPERVFKTLVVRIDGRRLAMGIVPVAAQLDLNALAGALSGRRAEMAPPADAERATGYVVGGISPLGQKRRLDAALDESALAFDRVYVSAGRRGVELALAPSDLARLSSATVAAIARR